MKRYRSYHTTIKQLAKRNTLPKIYSSSIDRSTIWRWKKEADDKYTGSELMDIEVLEEFISRKEAQALMKTYVKVVLMLSSVICTSNLFSTLIRKNKQDLVHTLIKYRSTIDLKLILRLLNIPISVFHYWKNQVLYKCESSPIQLCKRKYPHQLTIKEVSVITKLTSSDEFKYWPICSLAWYAKRENLLHVSLSTWYKYVRLLGLDKARISKKKPYKKGIRATSPNQIWHADITIVKTMDGIKSYVYLLMDNYSKYIINFRVEPVVSGKVRMQTIMDGYKNLVSQNKNIQLIIDGGPENNNHHVDEYVNSSEINIQKLVALKDIPFSNSLIEAQNKLLKYRYLFKSQYQDIEALRKALAWIVSDYNSKRPHNSLKGLTPSEAYSGKTIDISTYNEKVEKAMQARVIENQKNLCGVCQ